jgi:hypothetical protein
LQKYQNERRKCNKNILYTQFTSWTINKIKCCFQWKDLVFNSKKYFKIIKLTYGAK